jgi:1-pyrroline-5-carboxylate dehydrogenase
MAAVSAQKVTYATIAAQSEELHRGFEDALIRVRGELGRSYPMLVGGRQVTAGEELEDRSPIDTTILLGRFPRAAREQVRQAVGAAKAAFPTWSGRPWQERVAVLRQAAEMISEQAYNLGAIASLEVGKNRLESIGEVEEAADLIRYYCQAMEDNAGFDRPMEANAPGEHNRSVLKPYGVWVVISPFNFPAALAVGPGSAALLAGNTVVFKPSSETPLIGYKLAEILIQAGCTGGVVNFITASGDAFGAELAENPDVDGITFTGSYEVGFNLYRACGSGERAGRPYVRPCILELGGKNPTIVTAKADLDKAAEGVMRSAFGLSGQKCSACSRVYVEKPVKEAFLSKLVEKAGDAQVGDPTRQDVFVGPVVHQPAVDRFERSVEQAQQGGRVVLGGRVLNQGEFANGYFVEPTVIDGLPLDHPLLTEELFLPFVAVAEVEDLNQALELANKTTYGLTAGFFSEDEAEQRKFLDSIQAGVVYVNRAAGATTGAWPGSQPFGGWKGSGSSGRGGGGPYYLQQFMREQSQTVIK